MFILAKQCKIWKMLQLKPLSDWSVVMCFADTGVKKDCGKPTKLSKQLADISENVKYFPSSVSFSLQTGTSISHSHSADMPVTWYNCSKQPRLCVWRYNLAQTRLSQTLYHTSSSNMVIIICAFQGAPHKCEKSIIYLLCSFYCSENKVKHLDLDVGPLWSHKEHWYLSLSLASG